MIESQTLDGYLQLFLLSCRTNELSPATLCDYNQKMGAFVSFCAAGGIRRPEDVTAHHVRLFLLQLQERCKARSVHDYYGEVKIFFNWMVAQGHAAQSPMSLIKPPKVPRTIIQPFSSEQINRMLALCDDGTFLGTRNAAIILALLDTGLRLSELGNITLADVDFNRGCIKVMGKGAKQRLVAIGNHTQRAMLRYWAMRKSPLLQFWITEERRPLDPHGIQEMIRRLGKRAGIDGVRCSAHTFRHTFATSALRNGANAFQVQNLLGHSTLTMTHKYVATLTSEQAIEAHRKFSPVENLMGK